MVVRQRQVLGVAILCLLIVLGTAALRTGDDDGERIATGAGLMARAGVTTLAAPAPADVATTGTAELPAPDPAPTTTLAQPATTTTTTKAPATTTTAARRVVASSSTTAPAPLVAAGVTTTSTTSPTVPATAPTTTVPATTTTTVDPCRNSTDSKCGSFRFDPQPGTDNPMTVEVTIEPASPVAGQPMVFHITLRDPDGVSYDGTNFNFGNSGIGGSTPEPCAKFGPWDPPARDPASAVVTMDVGHTYFEAGTYTATFFFDAGPFDCTDSVTGRGDRPYASSATGTVTVEVAAAPAS